MNLSDRNKFWDTDSIWTQYCEVLILAIYLESNESKDIGKHIQMAL